MIELPDSRYGLTFRLVDETDAEFILSLRTDPKLGRYLSHTDTDLEKQKSWIREYKLREAAAIEYYFLYADENAQSIGVCRLYDIDKENNCYTSGSWLSKPGGDAMDAIKADLFFMNFAFDILKFEKCLIDVRLDNKKMLRYHKMFFEVLTEDSENVYLVMYRDGYLKKQAYLKSIITPNN